MAGPPPTQAQMVAFHFHGYQPGDVVRRLPGSPLEPPRWEERASPVALMIGGGRFEGPNWTAAMLACYDHFMDLFATLADEQEGGVCSIDVEPSTLQMVLAEDRRRDRDTYGKIMDVYRHGVADPVITLPYHPILPYLHPLEGEVLAGLALDFHGPILARAKDAPKRALGIWLPEAAYTREAAATVARACWDGLEPEATELYFILDGRQFVKPEVGLGQWSLNFLDLGLPKAVFAFGRDVELSDAFAFGSRPVEGMVDTVVYDRLDAVKEETGIAYLLTIATDLEALVGGATQVDRFRRFVRALNEIEAGPVTHSGFLLGKLGGKLKMWEGEGQAEGFRAVVRDHSSWSDYSDETVDGRTSDTRWRGMRRTDGRVIERLYRGRQVSQVWKQAFLALEGIVEEAVRRAFGTVLQGIAGRTSERQARDFLVAYGRVVMRDHFLRQGLSRGECSTEAAAERYLGGVGDLETLALAARGYHEMLMGLRSDPCFWENLDTRVTFQSAVFFTHALLDMAEACRRVGEGPTAERLLRLVRSHLVEFENAFSLYRLGTLSGRRGWETTEEAWILALQSEVPDFSGYNVVKRAALWVLREELVEPALAKFEIGLSPTVAHTGHIEGEGHGLWAEPLYCEHRLKG